MTFPNQKKILEPVYNLVKLCMTPDYAGRLTKLIL